MQGDFSQWYHDEKDNFNGVLHQQGRVLLDRDWNAAARIRNAWQDQAARDAIGPGVAAIPAQAPHSFEITSASVVTAGTPPEKQVMVTFHPGRGWIDGHLVYIADDGNDPLDRIALYLDPPLQDARITPAGITTGDRDAVILEVWREVLHGFQAKGKLIEPALGGPDTTERIHTTMALRLLRLEEDDDCSTIAEKVADDPSLLGTLAAFLLPPVTSGGDCPVTTGGGYLGFEHHLYRIEIARIDSAMETLNGAMFKWSRFNGGLVGRGTKKSSKVVIEDNYPVITSSGLTSFYLEAVEYDETLGFWRVTYGAEVTLDNDGQLQLPTGSSGLYFGSAPVDDQSFFFRLWDGIKAIKDFAAYEPVHPEKIELKDGIHLLFPPGGIFRAGDYWTFPVRAGEIENPEMLVGKKDGGGTITGAAPEGIVYHRVPLAIIEWQSSTDGKVVSDCRRRFRPLTELNGCCTYIVGQGGDFDSIQEAVDALDDDQGGRICVLSGIFRENVTISGKKNVQIMGCRWQTLIVPAAAHEQEPLFLIRDSSQIHIEDFDMGTISGTAVLIDGDSESHAEDIGIVGNRILALTHAVCAEGTRRAEISRNRVRMLDRQEGEAGIFFQGNDGLIEDNEVVLVQTDPADEGVPEGERPPDPTGDCLDIPLYYADDDNITGLLEWSFSNDVTDVFSQEWAALAAGGIQIGGGSMAVVIRRNCILGGRANGITLGHIPLLDDDNGSGLADLSQFAFEEIPEAELKMLVDKLPEYLSKIAIEANQIRFMGWNGIGVPAFFSLKKIGLLIMVEDLMIRENSIMNCLGQASTDVSPEMALEFAFGGISLADCENAEIRENRIENNGNAHNGPLCGIFIQHGEKIDISNNRILNNGPATYANNSTFQGGFGAGILIRLSLKKTLSDMAYHEIAMPDGIPAVKIHDNIVTQPVGQALFIMALGPVSVIGNQFTSQWIDKRSNPVSFLAGSVLIIDLGMTMDLLGWAVMGALPNAGLGHFTLLFQMAALSWLGAYASDPLRPASANTSGSDNKSGNLFLQLHYLPSGHVLFNDNQTTLDMRDPEVEFGVTSQLIFTLDDLSYTGNQSQCVSLIDWLLADIFLIGATVRVNDNRMREGVFGTFISLVSLGLLLSTCVANQADHCLINIGNVKDVTEYNLVLYPNVIKFGKDTCLFLYKLIVGLLPLQPERKKELLRNADRVPQDIEVNP